MVCWIAVCGLLLVYWFVAWFSAGIWCFLLHVILALGCGLRCCIDFFVCGCCGIWLLVMVVFWDCLLCWVLAGLCLVFSLFVV